MVSQALVLANNENSFDTVLKLIDENAYDSQVFITEFPILSALARNQEPSFNFLKKLKSYLESKSQKDIAYTRKLQLIYSSLVKTYCTNNECDLKVLEDLSSLFAKILGSNCADSKSPSLVTSSLKSIGNIGFIKDTKTLVNCALKKENSMEIRVSAVQAFRRFNCSKIDNTKELFDLLQKSDQDTELRINTFQILVKCGDSPKFQNFAKNNLPEFLEKETDVQVKTHISLCLWRIFTHNHKN